VRVASISQDIESRRAFGTAIHRQICQNQCCAGSNQCAYIGIELGRDSQLFGNVFQLWRAAAAACRGNPIPLPISVDRVQRAVYVGTGKPIQGIDRRPIEIRKVRMDQYLPGIALHCPAYNTCPFGHNFHAGQSAV
jgi:hypothetical protein